MAAVGAGYAGAGRSADTHEVIGGATAARLTALACFLIGALPLLALAFFSPGLATTDALSWAILLFGLGTAFLLVRLALREPWAWVVVLAQATLLGLVVYATLSDGRLYMGT